MARTFKSIEMAIAKRIADNNAKFVAADEDTKRVMIAKDVIQAIEAEEVIPTACIYIRDTDPEEGCQACALGAMFISRCNFLGEKKPDIAFNSTCTGGLSEYFTSQELSEIEDAFEGWSDDGVNMPPAKTRMRLIMQNIIRNKGEFVKSELFEGTNGK
jgi:hypothetical protein